jgi:hypothetical protein
VSNQHRGYCWMDLEIESRRSAPLWHTEIEQRRAHPKAVSQPAELPSNVVGKCTD